MKTTFTFLLVEDEDTDAAFTERELKKSNHGHIRVRRVNDGVEAVHYLKGENDYTDRRYNPLPDVILLDLNMPKFNGFDFLEWLHSESPGEERLIPVIVMSTSNLETDVKRAYALGANSYMVKPVDWQVFKERMKIIGIYWGEHVETHGSPREDPA